tara:strand:+ start:799 stop:1725 length:927 start_codon:yes stop_codon:yes gene_type:complete
MTYKDVLDDLINILDRHYMIVTWGYGNLSDLVTPFKKQDVTTGNEVYNIDYPYAFLQPTGHQLSTGKSTFNFNLIMMEQCEDNPNAVIQAQSNAYQYIKDCLAEIYYNYDQKFDFTLNSSVIPFKEKYDDTVSGMTATISIEIPTILDDCIAPFAPKPVEPALILDVYSTANYAVKPDITQDPLRWPDIVLDTYNGMRPDNPYNYYTIKEDGTYSFVVMGTVRRTTSDGVWPDSLNMFHANDFDLEPNFTTWPVDATIGVDYPFQCRWDNVPLLVSNSVDIQWRCSNAPAIESEGLILSGTNLKGYIL